MEYDVPVLMYQIKDGKEKKLQAFVVEQKVHYMCIIKPGKTFSSVLFYVYMPGSVYCDQDILYSGTAC